MVVLTSLGIKRPWIGDYDIDSCRAEQCPNCGKMDLLIVPVAKSQTIKALLFDSHSTITAEAVSFP